MTLCRCLTYGPEPSHPFYTSWDSSVPGSDDFLGCNENGRQTKDRELSSRLSLQCCCGKVFLSKRKCVDSIPHESKVIPKTDKWICPAPRASGLRQKQQCAVPSTDEERQKIAVRAGGGFDSDHDMQEGDNMSADLSSASFGC
jgi:hypothetical protein